MENQIKNKTSGRKKTLIILALLFTVFIIYYSVMSMISPMRKYASMKDDLTIKPDDKGAVDDRILSDSLYLRLLKEKAFLQAKVAMAETDSIYLTINMEDSTLNIEISGVIVHSTMMSKTEISKILLKGNENIILSLLSSPFTIAGSYSTIRKEPVMIKMAPKDTSEYKPDIVPDTSLTVPVNYILEMTNGTRIYIYQEENEVFSEKINRFKFDITDRLRETWSALKRVALAKVPEYHPYIKIRIPRADAKIIYRALPRNGQVAVNI